MGSNYLTDSSVDQLVRFLMDRRQRTSRLKLYKNQLKEPWELCRYMEDQYCGVGGNDGLKELHLSDNSLTSDFLARVLKIIRTQVKRAGGKLTLPFWLRVEKNHTLGAQAQRAVNDAEASGLKICYKG